MQAELAAILERARTRSGNGASGSTRPAAGTDAGRTAREEAALLERAGIYRRYQWVTLDAVERRGLPQSLSIGANWDAVRLYARDLAAHVERGEGLIMAGAVGTMKTTMAVGILREWLGMGRSGMMAAMPSLIDSLFTMRQLNREEWARYEQRLRRIPLLVLDDLGGESEGPGWVLQKVDSIVTERYNRMLPVIVTTNLTKRELAGTYPGRIMDRLRSSCLYLAFEGTSERGAMA